MHAALHDVTAAIVVVGIGVRIIRIVVIVVVVVGPEESAGEEPAVAEPIVVVAETVIESA
jgi:hypothetical protein